MATSLTNRLDVSKEKIAELREDAVRRAKLLQKRATQRSEIVAGTIRYDGLAGLMSAGETALGGVASVARKLPFADGLADTFEARASALSDAESELEKPDIDDYDDLNVKQVSEALEGLDAYELLRVKRYEKAHKDRKTVFAAIERQLA